MTRTIYSIKKGDRAVRVLLVDPVRSLPWWDKPAYFVTTSEGEFLTCADEVSCIQKARQEARVA